MALYFVIDSLRSGKQLTPEQASHLAHRLVRVLDGDDGAQRIFGLSRKKCLENRDRYMALDYLLRVRTCGTRDKRRRDDALRDVAAAWKVGIELVRKASKQYGRLWRDRMITSTVGTRALSEIGMPTPLNG